MNQTDLPFSFEDLLFNFPDAVIVHDMEDRVLFWNRRAEELYGWTAEEISGRPVGKIFYVDFQKREEAVEALRNQGYWSGELRQVDRQGHERIVDVSQRYYRDKSGEGIAIVSCNRDVTELKRQEDAREHVHFVQSSNLLAGQVAHELNNVFAPIMLSSSILKRLVSEEKPRNMIEMIEKCANKGSALISDLRAFERGKGGGKEIINKKQILKSVKEARNKVANENLDLDVSMADDLWDFLGESADLEEIFEHIIQNACEAMPEGGDLTIEVANCQCDENFVQLEPEMQIGFYVRIAFKDKGIGIDEEHLSHVAEPFFTTKQPKQGNGFGLSRTQAIVKGHHGFMFIESVKDIGTTVTLYFPAVVREFESREEDSDVSGEGRMVLVADDELFVRETIRKTLEERGYQVETAQDGTEALAFYAGSRGKIDLVLTNVEMPFMDGPALCRALKKFNPDVRILVSSGHKQKDKALEIKDCGVEHFLEKHYTADQLCAAVKKALEE